MKKIIWTIGLFIFALLTGCGGSKDALWTKAPMHPEGNFDGVYQSDFGRLELTASPGSKDVTGLFEKNDKYGRIEGRIKGNLLFFTWTQWDEGMRGKPRETHGRGVFQYIVDENTVSGGQIKYTHWMKGFWAYEKAEPSNPWNAYKLSKKAKKQLKPYDPSKSGVEPEEEEDNAYDQSSFDDTGAGGGGGGGDDMGGGGGDQSAPADEGGGGGDDVDIF